MTTLPNYTPFYGGGQVSNPANVIQASEAPSNAVLTENRLGTIAVVNSSGSVYILASKSGGVDTWNLLEASSGSGSFSTLTSTGATTLATTGASVNTFGNTTGATSVAIKAGSGGIGLTGTTNVTGSLTASTTLTATLGAVTASNGNLVLGTAGNKLAIAVGSNASCGVSAAMSGSGTVSVSTTACTASSVIVYSRATTGGTTGEVSITAQSTSGFTLTSTSSTETSTFNYLIIN